MDLVIKETLRLYPTVPIYGRTILEDFNYSKILLKRTAVYLKNIFLDGVIWPKGMDFMVNVFATHRNPKYFPDPEKFDPERFASENYDGKHPYSYVPFSAGPRNCIGK